jgi:hypothetical protein
MSRVDTLHSRLPALLREPARLAGPCRSGGSREWAVEQRRAMSRIDTLHSRLPALLREPARLVGPCRSGGSREWVIGAAAAIRPSASSAE